MNEVIVAGAIALPASRLSGMNLSLSPEYIASGLVALAVAGWNMWLQTKLRGINILFNKSDAQEKSLNEFRLHVAETCVSREQLKELLIPIYKDLDVIKDHILKGSK